MFLFPYVLTLVSLLAAVSVVPGTAALEADDRTNAQRLAAGLPLLPPKFKRAFPGHAQARDDPTPAFGAKRSTASSKVVAFTGHIQVKNTTGWSFGYLAQNASGLAGVASPQTNASDIVVSFTTTSPGSELFSILITNPNFTTPFYLGANGTDLLSSSSPSAVDLDNVAQTAPSATPSTKDNEESAIWSIDARTKELTAQWVNSDKSTPKTYIVYDEVENLIFFTGNVTAFTASDRNAVQVKFYLSA